MIRDERWEDVYVTTERDEGGIVHIVLYVVVGDEVLIGKQMLHEKDFMESLRWPIFRALLDRMVEAMDAGLDEHARSKNMAHDEKTSTRLENRMNPKLAKTLAKLAVGVPFTLIMGYAYKVNKDIDAAIDAKYDSKPTDDNDN